LSSVKIESAIHGKFHEEDVANVQND